MSAIRSVDELVNAVGGGAETAALVGVVPSAVSNWRARRRIPAEHFFVLNERLKASGLDADPSLFGFSEAPTT